jgi:hypothetical protein
LFIFESTHHASPDPSPDLRAPSSGKLKPAELAA